MEKDVLKVDNVDVLKEIFSGKTMDIILELMDRELTEQQLLDRLEMYPIKLKYYLGKLLDIGIIEKINEDMSNVKVKTYYKLKKENINLFVNNTELGVNFNSINDASKYGDLVKKGFNVLAKNSDAPNKETAVFIHSSREDMLEFKKELDVLVNKFLNKEDKAQTEGYLLLNLLLPYEMDKEN